MMILQQWFAHPVVKTYVLEVLDPLPLCNMRARDRAVRATNQTEFNMDTLPTRHGRPQRTRDMAEIYVCICGNAVEVEARVMGSNIAVHSMCIRVVKLHGFVNFFLASFY